MKDKIKADNYIYTKDITKKVIRDFEKGLKEQRSRDTSGNFTVLELNPKGNSWTEYKRTVSQVHDFLKSYTNKIRLVFDGNNKFQMWLNLADGQTLPHLKKIIKSKFEGSALHNLRFLNKSNKIKLYRVNPKTGLASSEISRSYLPRFKKKKNKLDEVYKKITNKKFKWNKKAMDKESLKKKIRDYFTFNQDQIGEMYGKAKKNYPLKDRDKDNFFKQVTEVYKKKYEK